MKRFRALSASMGVALVLISGLSGVAHADAFNQNRIIDDGIFDNTNSMSATQIDNFLNNFPNSCISPNSGFRAVDPIGYNPTNGYQFGGFVTAGQVIYDSAQAYDLNPQVLLATLQKEQSLVIGGASYCNDGDQHKYAAAVGYGCPDSGTRYEYTGLSLYQRNGITVTSTGITCVNSPAKAGFSQQVIRAAWLFKFGEQRSKGNVGWAVIKGNWNNSDDPQTCYDGPMTQGTWQRCPSGSTTYYDGYRTIDGVAVHMESGATAALYWYTPHFHGNQNFFSLYTNWFGVTLLPVAFKTPNNGAVYVQASGFKFTAPSMALLQDYGISPESIQTVSQATADAIPGPDITTGLSSGLSYLVKSPSDQDNDGGAVYLVSVGRRYALTSMDQFNSFGFTTGGLSYLPLSYIYSLPSGGTLSNFIRTPSSNVFQVNGALKRIIFDGATYAALNPSASVSFVSTSMANSIASGLPITNREILVGKTNGAVYLLANSTYYSLASMDIYDCWGFGGKLGTPLYMLSNDTFVAPISSETPLSCAVKTDSSTTYLLNSSERILAPPSSGISANLVSQDLTSLVSRLPQRTNPLGRVIKTPNLPVIWFFEDGVKKAIPSMTDFGLLGLTSSQIETITTGAAATIPTSGVKVGVGMVVKSSESGTVFVITSQGSKVAFASGDDFLAYGYPWSLIETFSSATLDSLYPTSNGRSIGRYLYDQPSNKAYLMDAYGCYTLSPSSLTSYGQSLDTIQSSQPYTSSVFPYIRLSACKQPTTFVKSPDKGTVYWVDGGNKYPISSWSKLVSLSHQNNPYIATLSSTMLATLPVGATL